MGTSGGLETDIRIKVRGVSFMGNYDVEEDTVVLTSSDFGEASSKLNDAAPRKVAEQLLRELAEAAMARPGASYLPDEELKGSSPVDLPL
ncbi:MAG: hypothetical protein ACRYHQ_33955 [Janthinobacterium lividum]